MDNINILVLIPATLLFVVMPSIFFYMAYISLKKAESKRKAKKQK